MGQFKDAIDAAEAAKNQPLIGKAQQLENVRLNIRRIGGMILSSTAEYKDLLSLVADADDQALLDARKAEAIASVKADFESADPVVKAIVESVLTDLMA